MSAQKSAPELQGMMFSLLGAPAPPPPALKVLQNVPEPDVCPVI
jgi:hypothetical protein